MLSKQKIWVNWKYQDTPDGRKTKVPYQINGRKASSTDPNTWSTQDETLKAKGFDGIGIVLEPTVGIIGIDFDHCVSNGQLTNKYIQQFIKEANTYCEYSPSKTGLHLLFQCKESLELERNKYHFNEDESIEIYNNGRYFTFTQDRHIDSKKVRGIKPQEFYDLIKTLGYPWKKEEIVKQYSEVNTSNIEQDDEKLLLHIFNSKNGEKIKNLYNGDLSSYSDDHSSADFALCLHLAFWTGRDTERMRRIWLSSPLANRKKTQERKDYQDRTLDNAVQNTTDIYTAPTYKIATDEDDERFLLSTGKNPYPLLILENICRVLSQDDEFKTKFRLNDFSHMVETIWDKLEWTNLFDNAVVEVQRVVSQKYEPFRKVSRAMITDAILSVAYHHKVNPPRDYFTSLLWDKTPRLNSWLHHAYGTPDDELHQAIGSNWIKGLVKRVMRPGCIFDEVIALESPQGWRKSTSIRELGTPWHVETTHSLDDKDFYMQVSQNIIVEFSEGDIFDRQSVKKLKAEITKTEDQFRPPYERGMLKFKRSCVFAVTTNKLELKDDTGNRRWLPVQLEKSADIDWIKENRDQLFAEAYHRVIIIGETTHEYPKESLENLQSSRGEYSDYDEKIMMWYVKLDDDKRRDEGITLHEACDVIFAHLNKISKLEELQVSSILRRILFLDNRSKKINGATLRRWLPTEKTEQLIKDIIKSTDIDNF